MAYIGQEPGLGEAERFVFTGTAVTDTVTADDNGLPINYTVGQVSVYLNGVKQVVGTDVGVGGMNGSTVVFAANYAIGDVVEVIALSTFSPADTVPATGGTFTGAVTASAGVVGNLTGNASGTAATVTTAAQPAIESVGTLNTLTVDNVIVDGTTIGHTSDTDLLTLTSGNLAVAGIVTAPSLVLTPGSAPGSPAEGAIYYDSTSDKVKVRNASAWLSLNNINVGLGGNITSYIDSGTTYMVHTFLSSGAFIVQEGLTVDYLIVAGGGGSGQSHTGGAGGGAGGLLTATGLAVTAQSYTIVVGAGGVAKPGTASSTYDSQGNDGNPSSALTLSATGGGGGGAWSHGGAGRSGGSGGGAESGATVGSGIAGPPRQGYNGGAGASTPAYGGGGGGGAGAYGGNGATTAGGNGGVGLANYIRDGNTSGTTAGIHIFAGGGGGGTYTASHPTGSGGAGGGGGNGTTVGVSGLANTGGGGGGNRSVVYAGGAGGSGIVIIRYAI